MRSDKETWSRLSPGARGRSRLRAGSTSLRSRAMNAMTRPWSPSCCRGTCSPAKMKIRQKTASANKLHPSILIPRDIQAIALTNSPRQRRQSHRSRVMPPKPSSSKCKSPPSSPPPLRTARTSTASSSPKATHSTTPLVNDKLNRHQMLP